MTLSETIEKVKGFFKGKDEIEEPPRELRDKHLESLEREWQYYENQKRKEFLKEKLKKLKLKQIREHVFGVKEHHNEKNILHAKLEESGVDLTKEKFNLMKSKKLFR